MIHKFTMVDGLYKWKNSVVILEPWLLESVGPLSLGSSSKGFGAMVSMTRFIFLFRSDLCMNKKVQHGDRKSKKAKISCLSFSLISSLIFSRPITKGKIIKYCLIFAIKPSDDSEPFFVRFLVFFLISSFLRYEKVTKSLRYQSTTKWKPRKINFCNLRLKL